MKTFPLNFPVFPLRAASVRARFSLLSISIAAIGSSVGNLGWAGEVQLLDTLVVTATRLPAKVVDQPVNITVLTRADIERSSAISLPGLLATVVGIQVRSQDSSGNGSVDIRGFGVTGASNTQILLNGIKLNDNDLSSPRLTGIALENIVRIEIVKGGAVMYGGGVSGGVVNIITRQDVPGLQGNAALKAGSFHTREGVASLSWAEDGYSLGVEGRNFRTDGYRANSADRTLAGSVELGIAGTWGKLRLLAASERQDSRFAGARKVDPSKGIDQFSDDPTGTSTPNDWGKALASRIVLHGEGGEQALRWAFDVSRREKRIDSFFDYGFGYSAADRRETTETRVSPRVSMPLTLGGLASTLSAGLDWSRADLDRFSGSLTPSKRAGDGTLTTRALWLDYGVALSGATRLTIGLRRESASQQTSALKYDGSIARADRSDSPTAWQIGLRQQLSSDAALYAKAGRSFRLPNADELVDNDGLKPQTSLDLEAGLSWQAGAVQSRAAVYRMRLDNEIAFQPYVNGFGQNINLAPTQRQGVELETRWRGAEWDVAANVTWLDATFRSGVYGDIDVSGKRVPIVPRWLANIAVGWQVADTTRLDALLHSAGSSHLDNDQPNTGPKLEGFSTLDLKLSHRIGAWRLALAGENLADKKYAEYGVKSTFGPNYNLYPHQGRRWLLTGAVQF